ncbi:efflux pump antibiotic resistance protein, putative [Talaromyces stipitatus ATCC 10500]|uniref:Efflux pump antibiotic resistance protein, putative n=1 Tax=Talaromyces stipitatus (strain ATCC 10500 / CBS 375.48 / QM 6759 / NRRL 1006) TaxID=441959 RepID=B8MDU0_TALSN|nr:efflux pump antibiotic resistance protein, putative [Talaromyces stipitatus ATCC 10500]EED18319.1 efflux pump antibiotic resistance protein, putative [Talaromyces stipitatus ATCC 10500]
MAILKRHESDDGSSSKEKDYQQSNSHLNNSNDDLQRSNPTDFSPATTEADVPPRDINGWKWCLTLVSILASTFLYALDATVVADLQPVILQELGGIQELPWLSVAFLLSATATNLLWGRMYGHITAKWFYIFHVAVFEVGSAICGAAPSINVMILGRTIAGMGGSGLYVGCMTLIATTTTLTERPIYVSCTGFTWGLGIVLGPLIGGAFSKSSVGWRWAFYINLFIGAVCAPFYIFLIPKKDPRPGISVRDRVSELDYPGIVLQAGMLSALILAINTGGILYPWNSGRIIATFVVFGLLWVLLGIQQVWAIATTVSRRIIPVQFFRSRTVLLLFVATAAGGACAFTEGALEAGVRLLPFVVVMVVFVFVNGQLMARLGHYIPWFFVGGLLTVAGAALMYTVDQGTSEDQVYGYTVLIGTGVGMYLQASFSVTQAVVDMENIAPAIGFITLAQFIGITIALAIANSILLNSSQDRIQHILPDVPVSEIQGAILGAGSSLVQNLPLDLKIQVFAAIVDAIDEAYVLVIAGGALVAISSLFMRRQRLFGAAPAVAAA